MSLIELAEGLGLNPKKTSNSKGGEYHSACPACGEGKDRFMIWPQLNRYWCRRCESNGDAIQFCRDFMNMSFHEACDRINDAKHFLWGKLEKKQSKQSLITAKEPPWAWQEKALSFVKWAHDQLKRSPKALEELYQRGFQNCTIDHFMLGFSKNSSSLGSFDFFREKQDWGLPDELKQNGTHKRLWLPCGLVIPTISKDGSVMKIKIRRHEWNHQDHLPKYVEISGSMLCPSLYGDLINRVIVLLESELDAMLIQQEAKDICNCVALGGAGKKPDLLTDQILNAATLILLCLDNDEAGRGAAQWWREMYPNLRFWPAPKGKSPGDALKDYGVNLRDWISSGIAYYTKK